MPESPRKKALPHGYQEPGIAQHAGRCQRESQLAHLRRLCPVADGNCPSSLCRGTFWSRLKEAVYALDASTIDLCLSVFSWAPFRSTKAAIKPHTLLDLRGNIPSFLHISAGNLHDVNVLDLLLPEPDAFYVMDRGYIDFERRCRWQVELFFKLFFQMDQATLRIKFFFGTSENCGQGSSVDRSLGLPAGSHRQKAT